MCQALGTRLCSSGLSRLPNGSPYSIPTRRRAAATPSTAASASPGGPQLLDRGWLGAHELADVGKPDEDGVEPGSLEGGDDLTVGRGYIGDGQLSRRHVGQQLEHAVERQLVVLGAARGDEEDLGVDSLERQLELLVVVHVDDALQAAGGERRVASLELLV